MIDVKDYDLEDIILGTILVDNRCLDYVFSNLKTDDFFKQENQLIYNSFLRLYSTSKKVDMVSLMTDLKENGEKSKIEINYILNLTSKITSSANVETHVEMLKNESVKKHLTLFAQKIYADSTRDEISAISILADFINEATILQNRTTIQKVSTFKEVFIDTVKECIDTTSKEMIGLTSGFNSLDSKTSGFSGPDLTIIAAGPGEGKSTFALNIAKHISMNYGDVLYFSYEMKEKQLIWKLMSDDLNKSIIDIRLGNFEKDYLFKNKTHLAKLHVYDKGGLTIDDIIGIAKIQSKKLNLKILIIDYLQLIRLGSYTRKVANKNDEVTIISNKLKQLAMELDLPIIALSQLNRDKTRRRYVKADLRDSGSLEQDADNIIFIFRPSEHNMTEYEIAGVPIEGVNDETTIINIDKWRLGRTGEFEMIFKGECSRFEDKGKDKTIDVNYNENPYGNVPPNKSEQIPF